MAQVLVAGRSTRSLARLASRMETAPWRRWARSRSRSAGSVSFHHHLRGVFLKKTQDLVEDTSGGYLELCPLPGAKVRIKHFNGRWNSHTNYFGEALEPYVVQFNFVKYHDEHFRVQ